MSVNSSNQIHTPASAEEVSVIVRTAAGAGESITTSRHKNLHAGEKIDLRNMAAVVDYPARDMTISVQAGMPVVELTERLAVENQQLPIDCPDPTATVGALVAANVSGPRQYGYGTLRDYLIGIEAVDGQGRIFHAGGRVVKNVAGYDLCRLMIGSRGVLGVLTQLTFKLKPIPENTAGIAFGFGNSELADVALEKLNTSAANPVILDYTHDADAFPFTLRLAVEGNQEACDWQLEQLRSDCVGGEEFPFSRVDGQTVEEYCQDACRHWQPEALRIQTLPSRLITVAQELAQKGFTSYGRAGNGMIYVRGGNEPGELRSICDSIIQRHSGHVVHWNDDHPANNTNPLNVRIRKTFDPNAVFKG